MSLTLKSVKQHVRAQAWRYLCTNSRLSLATAPDEVESQRNILSGIQPTGIPHIGNYLGALKQWVALQEDNSNRVFYMIADYHAITMPLQREKIFTKVLDMAACLLACGINPQKSVLFQQSELSQHTELAWILNCFASVGQLNRMTQFKSKSAEKKDLSATTQDVATVGLYTYPVLQAADILLYNAEGVPVGDDQMQHLELVRDIAQRFNAIYENDTFILPKAIIPDEKAQCRIMSLRDGQKKMSKSDPSQFSRIELTDTADEIRAKLRKAKTDTIGPLFAIEDLQEIRPEVFNLLTLYSAFCQIPLTEAVSILEGKLLSEIKQEVTDAVISTICPIGEKIYSYRKDPQYLLEVLSKGREEASIVASTTIAKVKQTMGFRQY